MQSDNTSKNRPPRRKACEDCSKSKRRCDLMLPACSRCSKLSLACHYQFPPQRAMGSPPANGAASMDDANLNLPLLDDGMLADPLPYTESLDLPFADDGLVSDAPPYLVTLQSSSKIASVADPINFDLFNPAESRLQYIVELFKSAPSRMVLENSTPWCHPLLYSDQVPKSMHDAYAACAMYIAKNDVNKRMIFRAIDTGAQELLKSPQSTKPIEILARVQSLLLYQIIRLFDGDIRLRAQGETDMGDLEINAYLLLSLINDHDMWVDPSLVSPEISSSHHWNSNPPPHATWIFQESCRRTVLLCLFFTSFYGMLRETSCIHGMIAAARTFTLCAQLWNARSEFDFKVAWKEKKQFIIENLNFEEVLLDAAPEDIDDFGKAFLVLSQGLDNMREWYYKRGGSLL